MITPTFCCTYCGADLSSVPEFIHGDVVLVCLACGVKNILILAIAGLKE